MTRNIKYASEPGSGAPGLVYEGINCWFYTDEDRSAHEKEIVKFVERNMMPELSDILLDPLEKTINLFWKHNNPNKQIDLTVYSGYKIIDFENYKNSYSDNIITRLWNETNNPNRKLWIDKDNIHNDLWVNEGNNHQNNLWVKN